jgi:hypothetical protein
MDRSSRIHVEIQNLWHECQRRALREPTDLQVWRTEQQKLWSENESSAIELLQPWLAIFEFGLDWLGAVHLSLNNEDDIGPRTPNVRVPWALVGSACAFGWSLRQACLAGFDTPARALLRTYVEALFLCLATLHDKKLGEAYQAADTDSAVVNFWHTQASPKNLHRRIIDIERNTGFDPDLISDLTEWRRREYEVMSQSSHLSYLAAAMTCVPVSIEDDQVHRIGIFGRASGNSHRTIGYAARTLWYFCRMAYPKLLASTASEDALLVVNKEDENHQNIVFGWDVLSTVTRKHWSVGA